MLVIPTNTAIAVFNRFSPYSNLASLAQVMPKKRILVIDDNPSIRSLLRLLIESDEQFTVCGDADDGVKGIEKAKETSPDLILLDLSMPNMNGAEAASILKRILPHVPIILFTMHKDSFGKALAAAVHVDRVIAKPDGMSPLLESMRDALGLTPAPSIPQNDIRANHVPTGRRT